MPKKQSKSRRLARDSVKRFVSHDKPQMFTISVTRKEFLKLPIDVRRRTMKQQADVLVLKEALDSGSRSVERLVRRLFETRQEAKQAKAAMRQLAEEIGRCEMHYEPGEGGLECYHTNLPKERWCDICKQKLPVWENFHAKTNAAAGALRALLNAGRMMPPDDEALPQPDGDGRAQKGKPNGN